jgi:hypothetical protein
MGMSERSKRTTIPGGRYERDGEGRLRYIGPPAGSRPEAMDLVAHSRWFPGVAEWARCLLVVLAFLIDTALHAGLAVAIWFGVARYSTQPDRAVLCAVLAWIFLSFAHRTAIQRRTHTTFGKSLFGLRLHNPDNSPVTLWQLTKHWFCGVSAGAQAVATVAQFFS